MNILLWILQILLALHTIMGAIWKFSNSEQTVASLNAIPHSVWMVMSVIEILCALGLILAAFKKSLAKLIPVSAIFIGVEMLLFCLMTIFSAETDYNHLIYWLVVAGISSFIAYGRLVLKPL